MYSNKNQKRYNEENSSSYGNGGYQQQHQGYHNGGGKYQKQGQYQQQQQRYDPFGENQSRQGQSHQYGGQRPQTATQKPYPQQQQYKGGQDYNRPNQQQVQQYKGGQDYNRPQTGYGGPQGKPQYNKPAQHQQVQDPEASSYRIPFDKPAGAMVKSSQQGFNQRPQTSTVARSGPVAQSGQIVSLTSNQYKLKLGGAVQCYQYALKIIGMKMWDAALVQRIIKFKRKTLEKALGFNVTSGESIYVLQELEEDVRFDVQLQGEKYAIYIEKDTQSNVRLDDKFNNSDNDVSQQILNIIVKQAFRDTDLKQIGKTPRFFDTTNFDDITKSQLRIMSGFKASVNQTQIGCTLVIDSIFKFMSTQSCSSRIEEICSRCPNQQMAMQRCRDEFEGQSVIAQWGNQRQYIVDEVIFDQNPVTCKFPHNGEMLSIADYFLRTYKLKLRDPKQPLFRCRVGQNDFHLPTELCLLDGVPASMKSSMAMRDALARTRIQPDQKLEKVNQMVNTLLKQKQFKDWNIEIEAEPIGMQSTIMMAPQMIQGNQVIKCDDASIKKASIQIPCNLHAEEWIMCYDKRSFSIADKIYNDLCSASRQLKLKVEEPYWIELNNEADRKELDHEIRQYIDNDGGQYRHPKIVVFVANREQNYEMFKEVMLTYSIPSQVITCRNGQKFNLSKASNILRQINSKAGGDLYHLKFPDSVEKKRVMFIGIDVCHAGAQSVVGFSASINKEKSQYYSNFIVQKKGQEIVKDKMNIYLKEAIEAFATHHKGEFPQSYVIFRDGVGDAQRLQVLEHEIPQFEAAITNLQNKAAHKPEITVVVVNKRISQRFFVVGKDGKKHNPPPGCIIDTKLVAEKDDKSNDKFDFYLTPAACTQGCVLPTHFYVPKNDSSMSKKDIQQLTYTLCYFYFNWAGSIKVPAPCQYAHKIAEFYTNINIHRKKGNLNVCGSEAVQMSKALEQERVMVPINNRLHFL